MPRYAMLPVTHMPWLDGRHKACEGSGTDQSGLRLLPGSLHKRRIGTGRRKDDASTSCKADTRVKEPNGQNDD